ncbi:exopolyphosphatase [Anaerosporomusa subterranea]|uniref:Chaperone protein DnaK n=1 Tax=Anaerosporomusa subterranea TaxID=1794912 RepID=A0A154BV40_ANASB|nr:Ppx/GppA phosphatase family protein [Anaerosporomusa subterranea]KYZ77799.1 exopolyphosphatase [Anaerosporomusa subterranea]
MTERIAIIDLGSNSARLIVMHIYANGAYNLVYHQKDPVRLSEGMSSEHLLQPGAMERAIATMQVFAHMCNLFNVDRVLAVATAAVRNARNGGDFVREVEKRTGITLEVISGDTEALLGYIGVINTIAVNDAVLFDLGGGSTELTLVRNSKPEKMISLPFGAVYLTEKFQTADRVTEGQLADLRKFVSEQLAQVPWLKKLALPIVGIGGTARNIAKMDQKRKNYPFNKVHNYRLGRLSFDELWRALMVTSLGQRRKFPGLSTERADIIVAGSTIVKGLFDVTLGTHLIISGCGVREGLFWRDYLSRNGGSQTIDDILMHSTDNMLRFYKGDINHCHQVARLALSMFDGWQELHNLDDRSRKLLHVASLLHDIGITINYYDHPRHSAYLVENARLFGLTHREQMLTAVIAGWHNGPTKFVRNRIYGEFFDEIDWQTAKKLSLILAIAESLDTTQMQLIKSVGASLEDGNAILDLQGTQASVERQSLERMVRWFRKEMNTELIVK